MIHGFRKRRGCNTAIKDAKWDMMARQEAGKTDHQVFLDLSKAFDMVDWERLVLVMKAYGFGTRTIHFFTN
jgi:Reverse transcriptase (RNA-dependent DNA polymerase)